MGKNIMLVDDAIFMRMSLKKILVENGYDVIGEAGTGKEAVERYRQLNPDLVIMDITMPDMNGIDAVKEIREYDSEAKIIMCSAMGMKDKVVEAIVAGAKEFIVKPFEEDRVLEAVFKWIE